MKKSVFLILAFSLFLLSACSKKPQAFEEFYIDANIETIDKVILQDGSTGATKTITEQAQIDEFLTLTKDIQFTKQDNQEHRSGWRYGISLFDGEENFKFTLSEIDNTYYDTSPDIYPIVDTYYKHLDIEEK